MSALIVVFTPLLFWLTDIFLYFLIGTSPKAFYAKGLLSNLTRLLPFDPTLPVDRPHLKDNQDSHPSALKSSSNSQVNTDANYTIVVEDHHSQVKEWCALATTTFSVLIIYKY